jgi:hypothetical protein
MSNILCEYIKIGDTSIFEDTLEDDNATETAPAFDCGLEKQPCRYATRKLKCPIYLKHQAKSSEAPPSDTEPATMGSPTASESTSKNTND